MSRTSTRFAVDRIQGSKVVLIPDEPGDERCVDLSTLPRGTSEGAVIVVDTRGGTPAWSTARLDEARREELIREGDEILARLRSRDPGGDVSL